MSDGWEAALLTWQEHRDRGFREGRGPVKGEALTDFTGLRFYPPDPAWHFAADVAQLGDFPPEIALDTLDGGTKWFGAFGRVTVTLPGEAAPRPLTLYTPLGEEQPAVAFVPFRDATSGPETYGGGRYLDVPLEYSAGQVTARLDFNRAYFPACAFADGYSCPRPPQEHVFPIPVRVGERLAK